MPPSEDIRTPSTVTRELILSEIIKKGPIFPGHFAESSGLPRATVQVVIRRLIEEGMLERTEAPVDGEHLRRTAQYVDFTAQGLLSFEDGLTEKIAALNSLKAAVRLRLSGK